MKLLNIVLVIFLLGIFIPHSTFADTNAALACKKLELNEKVSIKSTVKKLLKEAKSENRLAFILTPELKKDLRRNLNKLKKLKNKRKKARKRKLRNHLLTIVQAICAEVNKDEASEEGSNETSEEDSIESPEDNEEEEVSEENNEIEEEVEVPENISFRFIGQNPTTRPGFDGPYYSLPIALTPNPWPIIGFNDENGVPQYVQSAVLRENSHEEIININTVTSRVNYQRKQLLDMEVHPQAAGTVPTITDLTIRFSCIASTLIADDPETQLIALCNAEDSHEASLSMTWHDVDGSSREITIALKLEDLGPLDFVFTKAPGYLSVDLPLSIDDPLTINGIDYLLITGARIDEEVACNNCHELLEDIPTAEELEVARMQMIRDEFSYAAGQIINELDPGIDPTRPYAECFYFKAPNGGVIFDSCEHSSGVNPLHDAMDLSNDLAGVLVYVRNFPTCTTSTKNFHQVFVYDPFIANDINALWSRTEDGVLTDISNSGFVSSVTSTALTVLKSFHLLAAKYNTGAAAPYC